MNRTQIQGRLNWLGTLLANQRNNLADVLQCLKGIGVRATTSLALHRKFIRLMEQVAVDRDKEMEILHEIETVEKLHLEMKQRKMLRCADAALSEKNEAKHPLVLQQEKKTKEFGILKVLGLLSLFSSNPVKHKNQDLTVD